MNITIRGIDQNYMLNLINTWSQEEIDAMQNDLPYNRPATYDVAISLSSNADVCWRTGFYQASRGMFPSLDIRGSQILLRDTTLEQARKDCETLNGFAHFANEQWSVHFKEQKRVSAQSFMNKISWYPDETQAKMRTAFNAENYEEVLNVASCHDIGIREAYDAKVTMHQNKDSGVYGDPYFTIEGLDEEFDSAAKAVEAYKIKNNIAVPDKKKHSWKVKHYFPESEKVEAKSNEDSTES